MATYEAVLFDLDGTLTDPKIGITKSIQYGLAKLGIQEDDLESLVPFIGAPLFTCLQERYALDETKVERIVEYYREYYSETGLYENYVYAGIPELLSRLCNNGKRLFVATLKPTVFAKKVLEYFRILDYFTSVSGSNLDVAGLSKPEIVQNALLELPDIPREKVVMVGDRKHDVIAARSCGIHSIAVTYGYGTIEELQKVEPDHFAESVKDLQGLLK